MIRENATVLYFAHEQHNIILGLLHLPLLLDHFFALTPLLPSNSIIPLTHFLIENVLHYLFHGFSFIGD